MLWTLSGWSSRAAQKQRFERLLRSVSYDGGSVLDWGCGAADLYAYLHENGAPFSYLGLDINERLIGIAEHRFGPHFQRVDLSHQLSTTFDYIFASGIFQFSDPHDPNYHLPMLAHMFARSRRGVAVNFLSNARSDENKDRHELYLDPSSLIGHAQALSVWWALDHAYHPGAGDFTLALLRPQGQTNWRRPDFPS